MPRRRRSRLQKLPRGARFANYTDELGDSYYVPTPRGNQSAAQTTGLGAGIGWAGLGAAAFSVAGQASFAMGAGQPYHWYNNLGAIWGIGGALAGGALGNPLLGGMIGAGIGGMVSGGIGGNQSLQQSQYMASLMTGIPAMPGYYTPNAPGSMGMAGPTPASFAGRTGGPLEGAANWLGLQQDPLGRMGQTFGPQAGYQALSMNSSFLMGGGSFGGLTGLTQRMMGQWGGPSSPAFQGASSALAPALADPFLQASFNVGAMGAGSVGLGGIAGAYNSLGPTGAFNAIRAAGGEIASFQGFDVRARRFGIENAYTSSLSNVAGLGVANAMLTGNRDRIGDAYDTQIRALSGRDRTLQRGIDFYHDAAMAGDPRSLVIEGQLSEQQGMVRFQRNQARLGTATRGPGADWINTETDLGISASISANDPFHPGFISNNTRRGLMNQDAVRLAQIEGQTRNNPAARAALSGERTALMGDLTEQSNAMKMGTFGSLLDVSLNTPTGMNGWGMGASSIVAAQRHDRGISPAAGGSGSSMGGGANTEIVSLLREISMKLGSGGPGGSGGTPYSMVNDRGNRKMGR